MSCQECSRATSSLRDCVSPSAVLWQRSGQWPTVCAKSSSSAAGRHWRCAAVLFRSAVKRQRSRHSPRRMPDETADALAALGYAYVPGNSGDKSDMVLRQATDTSKGFEWRGQQDYDKVGATVVKWIRSRLTVLGGLEEVTAGLEPATAYATPGWREHAGPFLLLVCGSAPGGAAGVWGRSLCINASTKEGGLHLASPFPLPACQLSFPREQVRCSITLLARTRAAGRPSWRTLTAKSVHTATCSVCSDSFHPKDTCWRLHTHTAPHAPSDFSRPCPMRRSASRGWL